MVKKFFFFGAVGLLLELFWTGLVSALSLDASLECHSSWWMFFIYGLAAFMGGCFELLRGEGLIKRGIVYTSVIFFVEYFSGLILRSLASCPWDYSAALFSVNGLIRLDYAPLWFIAGLFFEWLYFNKVKIWELTKT